MFGSMTFQQLSLKFVCKNGGNLTDLIAIYLWLVKIMSLFDGVRHYTQHSDVEGDYPSSWQVKVSSEVMFSENDGLTFETNFAVCKVWGIFILITRVSMKIKGKLF